MSHSKKKTLNERCERAERLHLKPKKVFDKIKTQNI